MIIGRAVTAHCFFTHLEVSSRFETKKTMSCGELIAKQ